MLAKNPFKCLWRPLLRRSLHTGVVIVIGTTLPGPLCGQGVGTMVGLKAGVITTGVHSEVDAFLNTDWRTGLSGGGFVTIDPVSNLTLSAGLLLSQRGFGFLMYHEVAGLIPGQAKVRSMELQMDVGLWELMICL